jgi:hypothetical protein
LTGSTTGTGVGVSNNAGPRITQPHVRSMNGGMATGRTR